jgi:hypothetical protein
MSYNFQDQPSESQSEWLGCGDKMSKNKPWWHEYKSDIPAKEEGMWKIRRGKAAPVSRDFPPTRKTPADEVHTALMNYVDYEWKTVMADSVIEIADNLPFVSKAYGKVLITGLGLGIVPHMLMEKPNVDEILIVEKTPEVVDMVAPYLPNGDITVVLSDAFTYTPRQKFDCAWHDIWTTIGDYMAGETERLFDRYGKYVEGFQMGWLYEATRVLRAYSDAEEHEKFEKCEEDLHALTDFEEQRKELADKSKWDTTTQSKLI